MQVGEQRDHGVLELHPRDPGLLRDRLERAGWVADPFPFVRHRVKTWVKWALREPHWGPGLHVEAERDGSFSVHIDVLSPGRYWPLVPLHALVDLWGWSTVRPLLLDRLRRWPL